MTMKNGPSQSVKSKVSSDFVRKSEELAAVLNAFKDRGDLLGFEGGARQVQEAFGLPDEVVLRWIEDASLRADNVRLNLGKKLRELADREQCFFEYCPPRVTFGCVEMHEERPGLWNLTVLDTVTVRKIEATSADELATAALKIIGGIENALVQVQEVAKALSAALQWVNDAYAERTDHPINLVRLLCTYGKDLRRQLGTGNNSPKIVISREAFGYVLARIKRLGFEKNGGYPELSYRGATQHVTKDPARYVSVPKDDNPRRASQHSAVVAINLAASHKEP